MRVKIGPYRYTWITCRIFDKWMYKKYGAAYYTMPEKEYAKSDKFFEKLEDIVQTIYNVTINKLLKFRSSERKIFVKIHPHDTFNMNETLAHIIVPMLKQLKNSKYGAPNVDLKDVPKKLHPTPEEKARYESGDYQVDEKFFARWEYVVDEMIFAFEAQYTDWEQKYYSGEADFLRVPIDEDGNQVPKDEATMFRLEDGPNHTFKVDRKGIEKEQKRIDNGLRLFGKYYQALWD